MTYDEMNTKSITRKGSKNYTFDFINKNIRKNKILHMDISIFTRILTPKSV